MATEILSFDAIFIPSSERVFLEFRPISRNRWEIGLANYEWNVFKVGKDASSTNNGTSRHEGGLPSEKLRSNGGELAGVQSDFEFRVESVRVHRRSSHASNPLSSVIRSNQLHFVSIHIYKIYTYTYINTYKSRRMRRKVQFDRQTFQRGAKSCSLTDDEYE